MLVCMEGKMPCKCADSCSCGPTCSCDASECVCETCKLLKECATCGNDCVCKPPPKTDSPKTEGSDTEMSSSNSPVSAEEQPIASVQPQSSDVPIVCSCSSCKCTATYHCGATVCGDATCAKAPTPIDSSSDKSNASSLSELSSNGSMTSGASEIHKIITSYKADLPEPAKLCPCELCPCSNTSKCGSKPCCEGKCAEAAQSSTSVSISSLSKTDSKSSTEDEDPDKEKPNKDIPKPSETASVKDDAPQTRFPNIENARKMKASSTLSERAIIAIIKTAIIASSEKLRKQIAECTEPTPIPALERPGPNDVPTSSEEKIKTSGLPEVGAKKVVAS